MLHGKLLVRLKLAEFFTACADQRSYLRVRCQALIPKSRETQIFLKIFSALERCSSANIRAS
jgi:hypothetical protein